MQMEQSAQNISANANSLISSIQNIDGQFNEAANSFYQNSNQIAENLNNSTQMLGNNVELLQGLSGSALEQINQMSQSLDQHANVLNQAVHMLNQSQNSFSGTIEEKQNALAQLSDALMSKSEEINQVIAHYEEAIGSALKETDQSTRDSAFRLQQSLNEMVVVASSKFSNATDEIRRATESIKSELEKTSNNLNTTIRQLPAQTKESAEQMRHAVTDQIKALQELSLLMQQNAQNSNFSRPSTSATSLKAEPPVFEDRPRSSTLFKQNFTANPSMTPKPATAPVKDGWVSNLLARASRGDESGVATLTKVDQPRPADHVIESLNSLSVDIVRAIDHNAAVQLWDHYRRGQRNIYTQKLYTLNGQKTFEKIRQKYLVDSDFRRSVNQYIADFEKLLRDVSRETGDRETIRKYLTSDTGKVYTMLAHASGRIQ